MSARRSLVLTLILPLAFVPGCRSDRGLAFNDPVPDFSLTERSGKTVTRDDLKGKVWVAGFIFTRCSGPCTRISGAMAALQSEFRDEKDFRLVSVTVDPDFDTPPVLEKYGKKFNADPEHWLFLTGPKEQVLPLITKGFWVAAEKNTIPDHDPGQEVTHSVLLWLVDQNGNKRAHFDGTSPADLAELRKKIALLLREGP